MEGTFQEGAEAAERVARGQSLDYLLMLQRECMAIARIDDTPAARGYHEKIDQLVREASRQ